MKILHGDRVSLKSIVEDTIGGLWGSEPASQREDDVDVLVVRGADFRRWETRRAEDAAPRRIPAKALDRRRLRPGDLVLEVSGGGPGQPVGRVLLIDEEAVASAAMPLICSNFCRKLRLRTGVHPDFVKRQLDLLYAAGHTEQFQTATTNIRNLKVDDFLEGTEVLLPDSAEQETVLVELAAVDRARDKVLQRVHAATEVVSRLPSDLVLAAGLGKLSETWRVAHANESEWDNAAVLTSLPKKRQQVLHDFNEDRPPELPESWSWVPLAAVAESVLGKMLDKAKNKGESLAYLRNVNVRWRGFDLSDLKEMRFEAHEADRYGLVSGDVLVCEGGEPGRAAVWRETASNMRFQKALHRVRCDGALLPDWLVLVLQMHAQTGRLQDYFTGSGIAHLTGVSLARVPVPLPPVPEQQEILRVVNVALDRLEAVERRIQAASSTVDGAPRAWLARSLAVESSA
ncbi:hypothetical protein [Geodermatophilus sp. SYSU D01176]